VVILEHFYSPWVVRVSGEKDTNNNNTNINTIIFIKIFLTLVFFILILGVN